MRGPLPFQEWIGDLSRLMQSRTSFSIKWPLLSCYLTLTIARGA